MRLRSRTWLPIYQSGKVWLNYRLDRLIDACDAVMADVQRIRWPALQIIVRELAHFVGDLAWLLRDFPRLDARQLTGRNWRIIFVGSSQGAIQIRQLFFSSEEVQQEELGRVALWALPSQTRRWLSGGAALVVCELSGLYPWRLRAAFTFTIPPWIRQILPLSKPLETLLAGRQLKHIRRRVNWSKKAGFSYRFTGDKADFDHFYYRMYAPYITHRHGSLASVSAYQHQWQWFAKGGLILVTRHGEPVAGTLVTLTRNRCCAVEGGVLDADRTLFQQGINTIIDWSALHWGHSQGATIFDMGGSCAWRSNGPFDYKQSWGAQVTRLNAIHSHWTFLIQDLSPALRDHINRQGFIMERNGRFYEALLQDRSSALDGNAGPAALREAQQAGLSGIAVVSPNHAAFYDAPDEPDEMGTAAGEAEDAPDF
jgi:hypothetical protein